MPGLQGSYSYSDQLEGICKETITKPISTRPGATVYMYVSYILVLFSALEHHPVPELFKCNVLFDLPKFVVVAEVEVLEVVGGLLAL